MSSLSIRDTIKGSLAIGKIGGISECKKNVYVGEVPQEYTEVWFDPSEEGIIDEVATKKFVEERTVKLETSLDNITNYTNGVEYAKQKGISVNQAINELIQKEISCYIPNVIVDITETILFNKDDYSFKCDGTLQTSSDIIMVDIDCKGSNIFIHKLLNNNTVKIGTAIKIEPKKDIMSCYNNINVNFAYGFDRGVYCFANNRHGIQYNVIKFLGISANRCIEFNTGSLGNAWINENTFYGGQLSGGVGVYTRKTCATDDKYNGNKFLNIGYEGIDKVMDIKDMKICYFDNARVEENINGDTWFDIVDCHSIRFTTSSKLPIAKINVDKTSCNSIVIKSYEGFRNGSNIYMANEICFGTNYRIMERNKPQSFLVYNNTDCSPILTNDEDDYAYGKLVRVKTTTGNNKKIIIRSEYLDLNFRNIDFILQLEMGQYSTISIESNGKTIKTFDGGTNGTIKQVYKIFINTQDGSIKKINIIPLSTTYEEYNL